MSRLGLIAGSALHEAQLPAGPWESVRRHEVAAGYELPHRIDYARTLRSLLDAGCDRVLALSSVGGLRPELGPGTTLVGPEAHRVPRFGAPLRDGLLAALDAAGVGAVPEGVYWQTRGPRLETPAEIRLIARYADVVGMTVGSECSIAGELGLRYAALCTVDNLASGIGAEELTLAEIKRNRERNRDALQATLAAILPALA